MSRLIELLDYGQSYWLDNLTRDKIEGGELKNRVETQGLRGVTSNPAIFDKAISGSDAYNSQIEELASQGKSTNDIYEALVIQDIQGAADVLRPVFDSSSGEDGYISLEVSPYLAHNTELTMDQARSFFKRVDRPNVMIKIPGTPAGIPAIEQMLYEGLNVNVTLLFSVTRYEEVAEAYVRALERRAAEGKPVDKIASVASFFLSRIDVLVDQLLDHRVVPGMKNPSATNLLGTIAVASSKTAYQSFKTIFSGPRWEALEKLGAKVQRPLWASTSTKNPGYSDVMYVNPLIGPNTVNTMPDVTIDAFDDHGTLEKNSVEKDLSDVERQLRELNHLGIDLDYATQRLVDEGVEKFIKPFEALMSTIESRAKELAKT
jgi:transaldolase